MTKKKVSSPVLPEASAPGTEDSMPPPLAAPRKRAAAAVKKSAVKAPRQAPSSARTSASKVPTPSGKTAKPVGKTQSRSPARSSARSPAPTQTRKPSRLKTNAQATSPDQPSRVEPILADDVITPNTRAPRPNKLTDNAASEKLATADATPPMLSVAELWEQGSPIRLRIAQLRTRNSLLDEQLQRLRPPVQVRGKKK